MASFSDLGIKASYIKSIKELGISNPSEIQELTIPILLKGKTDFIGLAQTGTGKTAAFGLPLLVMSEPFLGILASIQTFNLIIWQQKKIAKVFAIVFT